VTPTPHSPVKNRIRSVIHRFTYGSRRIRLWPWRRWPRPHGKILLDLSNPLDFSAGMPASLFVCNTDSLAEQIQRRFPRTTVIKAMNTMNTYLMVDPRQLADGDHSTFVCGDDAEAKATVTALLTELGHRDVIDLGGLGTARGTEMYLPLWIRLAAALGTPMFNIKVVR
jgi:8-hydroxy-5-deazaflavin:NADPH oxidoreductase